jgi:hypothetical protein
MDIMNPSASGTARELAMHLSLVSNIVIIMTKRCATPAHQPASRQQPIKVNRCHA